MFRYCLSETGKPKVEHPVKDSGTSSETLVDVVPVEGYSLPTNRQHNCRASKQHIAMVPVVLQLVVGNEPSP